MCKLLLNIITITVTVYIKIAKNVYENPGDADAILRQYTVWHNIK